MAFRRKDIKKAYYYVWFLGAKESKGLRGDQFILPVLRQLVNIERRTEPCKVTIQISNKGIKIIQNVPKKQQSNGQTASSPQVIDNNQQAINNQSSATQPTKQISSQQQQQNSTVKMEQIKHFIPHHAITSALQSEDVVCIILLLYNPITGCPVHVHGYRCDSIETAFTLRNQLQLLIDRPENQRKFGEIEARLASKGLISQQQLLNNRILHQQQQPKIIKTNQITNGIKTEQQPNKSIHHQPSSAQLIYNNDNRSKRNTLTSDGRSVGEEECDNYSPTRSEPDGQPSLNKSLVESKSSSGNSTGSSGSSPPPLIPNSQVVEMYENLAAELKAKLGNSKTGPILLPPKDYDTVCRSQGKLVELDKRACTNKLVVGLGKLKKSEPQQVITKSENLILETQSGKEKKDAKLLNEEVKDVVKSNLKENKDKLKGAAISKIDTKTTINQNDKELNEQKQAIEKPQDVNKIKKLNNTQLNEQEKRLNYQQIREQQKQYEQKLKNLQRKQELFEQQQLLMEQQKQVKREKMVNNKTNGKLKDQIKSIKNEDNNNQQQQLNSETVIHTGGIKQIGSNLANKIRQSLIGSNKDKLQPQLICHKTIHDSLQSLNKLTKTELQIVNDKFKSKKQLNSHLIKLNENAKLLKKENLNKKSNTLNTTATSASNSSSNISRDLNERLNTINSRSDSSNVSKSISSGIGSGANLNTTTVVNKANDNQNYDEQQYLSTDEELEEEALIHDLSECVDEYMPDYVYNQYLNDEDDEIIDDLDDDEINNRVIKRNEIRDKQLLLLDKNSKKRNEKLEITGLQMISSEDDDGTNSICYDENLLPKINTAKRIRKQQSSKPMKLDQNLLKKLDKKQQDKNLEKNLDKNAKNKTKNQIELANSISNSTKSSSIKSANKNTNKMQPSINQVRRSETYYENSGQKRMFYNNYYFPNKSQLSSIDNAILNQPQLFYFPNPEFKAATKLINSQIKQPQYHLGQQQPIKHTELRRQKSTPNVNGKLHQFSYHPMLVNRMNNSVEKLISNDEQMLNRNKKLPNLDKYKPSANLINQRGSRPISMVNMMQPDQHFRISHHQSDRLDRLVDPNAAVFKRVPIYY